MNVDFPHSAAAAASPLARGERIKVRGFSAVTPCMTLTLPLSLAKEEATRPGIVRCWSFLSIEPCFVRAKR